MSPRTSELTYAARTSRPLRRERGGGNGGATVCSGTLGASIIVLRRNATLAAGTESVLQQRPSEPRLDPACDEQVECGGGSLAVVLLIKELHRPIKVERGAVAYLATARSFMVEHSYARIVSDAPAVLFH